MQSKTALCTIVHRAVKVYFLELLQQNFLQNFPLSIPTNHVKAIKDDNVPDWGQQVTMKGQVTPHSSKMN